MPKSKAKNRKRAAAVAGAARGSETVRVKLTFRCLEYHTIERDVPKSEFDKQRKDGDVLHWLDGEYRDCDMADSDINTESFELDEWETVKSPNAELCGGGPEGGSNAR